MMKRRKAALFALSVSGCLLAETLVARYFGATGLLVLVIVGCGAGVYTLLVNMP